MFNFFLVWIPPWVGLSLLLTLEGCKRINNNSYPRPFLSQFDSSMKMLLNLDILPIFNVTRDDQTDMDLGGQINQ